MPLTDLERALFARARERIVEGSLPRTVPESVWAGPGSCEACGLCESTIEPEQVEYELSGSDGVRFRFHMRCHAIWQLAASDRTGGS
jgi:hypothetical protein